LSITNYNGKYIQLLVGYLFLHMTAKRKSSQLTPTLDINRREDQTIEFRGFLRVTLIL